MLWLYRRLPRGYGRPPAVERSINALAQKTGVEVAEFLAEREASDAPQVDENMNLHRNQVDETRNLHKNSAAPPQEPDAIKRALLEGARNLHERDEINGEEIGRDDMWLVSTRILTALYTR
jgi:hypothetical protein